MLVFLGIFRVVNSFLYLSDMMSDMCTVYVRHAVSFRHVVYVVVAPVSLHTPIAKVFH